MPDKYEYIDTILTANGLVNPRLNVLVPNHELYSTMMYQHQGHLVVVTEGDKFIGNDDHDAAVAKHLAFFKLVSQQAADLAMTPEYSCPSEVLDTCLASGIFPAKGKLWGIGCESLRPAQLRDFIAANHAADTFILAEEPAVESEQDKLLDPFVYLFLTNTAAGAPVRVVLFQFKRFPMGATDVEALNLQFGTRRFVLRNNEDSIYLATILCSESLDIDLVRDLRQFVHKPYLLLHPQMNKGARTDAFKNYRTHFYNTSAEDAEKDMLCLNWAGGSQIAGTDIGYGNTAFYTKAKKVVIGDQRISSNDELGLFYNCWSNARASILVFSQQEAVYQFENSKTSKGDLPVQNQGRFGPQMLQRYIWDAAWTAAPMAADATLVSTCAEIGGDFSRLMAPGLSSVNKERLLSLSVGEIPSPEWMNPSGSSLFTIGNNEESNRLLVFQDPLTRTVKMRWLNRYATLVNYLGFEDLIPADSHLTDLAGGVTIHYAAPNLHYNVTGPSDMPACIVYAGDIDPALVRALKANLLGAVPKDNKYRVRLMVLYHHLGVLCKNYEALAPTAAGNNNENPIAFNKKRP